MDAPTWLPFHATINAHFILWAAWTAYASMMIGGVTLAVAGLCVYWLWPKVYAWHMSRPHTSRRMHSGSRTHSSNGGSR